MNDKQQRAKVNITGLARNYGEKALTKLVALIDDPDPRVAKSACEAVLDRGYGRPLTMTADVSDRLDDMDDDALASALDTVRTLIRSGKQAGAGVGSETEH